MPLYSACTRCEGSSATGRVRSGVRKEKSCKNARTQPKVTMVICYFKWRRRSSERKSSIVVVSDGSSSLTSLTIKNCKLQVPTARSIAIKRIFKGNKRSSFMVKERLERQMGLQQSGIPGARLIVAGELYALYVDVLISFADCIRSIRSLDSIVSISLSIFRCGDACARRARMHSTFLCAVVSLASSLVSKITAAMKAVSFAKRRAPPPCDAAKQVTKSEPQP